MTFFVYMIGTKVKNKTISYVGYTNNLKNRLNLHNTSKGAKFTRGRKWKLIYYKKYKSKNEAMKFEYNLKKDRVKRNRIKLDYLKENENINFTSI